jgi:hypothetical protein
MAQRRLPKKTRLQLDHVVGVLPTQRIESAGQHCPPPKNNLAGYGRDTLAEQRYDLLPIEAVDSFHDEARDQQDLKPVGKPLAEEPGDPDAAVEEIGRPEAERQRKGRLTGPPITEASVTPRCLGQRVGVTEQDLDGRRRGGPTSEHLKDQHPFLIGEGDKSDC